MRPAVLTLCSMTDSEIAFKTKKSNGRTINRFMLTLDSMVGSKAKL